jgi:hypothetical protein
MLEVSFKITLRPLRFLPQICPRPPCETPVCHRSHHLLISASTFTTRRPLIPAFCARSHETTSTQWIEWNPHLDDRYLMALVRSLMLGLEQIITWIPRRNHHVMVSHMFISNSICFLYLYNRESFIFQLLSFLNSLYQIMASQDLKPLFPTSTFPCNSTETFSLESVVSKHQTLGRKITNNY